MHNMAGFGNIGKTNLAVMTVNLGKCVSWGGEWVGGALQVLRHACQCQMLVLDVLCVVFSYIIVSGVLEP